MKYKILFFLGILLVVFWAGIFTQKKIHKCPKSEVVIDTVYKFVEIEKQKLVPVYYQRTRTDTIYKDSVRTIEVKKEFVAEKDTTFDDDLLWLNVKYISDIPLSFNSYFDIKAKVKQTEVIKTIPIEKTFNPRFLLEGGIKIISDSDNLHYFANAGVNLISTKYFKIPIYYGGVYNPELKTIQSSFNISIKLEF